MELITIKVTKTARDALDKLVPIMAKEKGLASMTLIDAASIAIQETLERREKEQDNVI